jgi:hypothetical protein
MEIIHINTYWPFSDYRAIHCNTDWPSAECVLHYTSQRTGLSAGRARPCIVSYLFLYSPLYYALDFVEQQCFNTHHNTLDFQQALQVSYLSVYSPLHYALNFQEQQCFNTHHNALDFQQGQQVSCLLVYIPLYYALVCTATVF